MPSDPHHIIAIGASAGGLEEINTFFDHTPLDQVSYVVVQHLSADFKSRLAEVVAKHSKLEVQEAKDNMLVKSNKVYIIPNDKFMTINGNRFTLTDKIFVKGPHLTINTFFNSLAEDAGKKAIGVILSGMGADGSEGSIAIKKAGGMVIARNPGTSDFPSMPTNAINTGAVDSVLEPEAMPDAIDDYVQQTAELAAQSEEDKTSFAAITDLIKERSVLDFSDYKPGTILRRVKRRADYNKLANLEEYYMFLLHNPGEIELLSKDFLISVTAFFRDAEAFNVIKQEILPNLIKKQRLDEELKFWVAGCATGEEAYSMAIILAEQLTGELKRVTVKIFATDIDDAALQFAGKGCYRHETVKNISPEILEKYFTRDGENYKVTAEIRKMVIFAHHDMVKNPPYCNMSLISCRNVLIYMSQPLQKKIFLMLLFGLKMDGYLFLGSSENPQSIIQNLAVVSKKWKIYKNMETKRVVRFDAFSLPELREVKNAIPSSLKKNNNVSTGTIDEVVNMTIVSQMESLVVCIDSNDNVVKTYGDTGKYLLQKNFLINLTELLPRPLAVAFNTLRSSVVKTGTPASASGIVIQHGTDLINVNIVVSPVLLAAGDQKLLVITFSEQKSAAAGSEVPRVFNEDQYFNEYTNNLENELKGLKASLDAANSRINASDQSMQSFNEVLLSTNEELQSTNEEMQSVNEELHTINSDYQSKNRELQELNDDLNNYFRSNINGQLFVNNDLLLLKFSPGTMKQINVSASDIGRPLGLITTNIKMELIIEDIKKVLKDGNMLTREMETMGGKWLIVVTMPYIQGDNTVKGAIISFNDVTELKKTQLELNLKNISLLQINADLDNFVHITSHDLLAPLGNIEMSIAVMNQINVPDPVLNKYIDIINNSVQKFRSLISDISTMARTETGMLDLEMIDLNELLNDVEWSLENSIKISGTVITRSLEVKQLLFSRHNLRSIIFNLVANSIKFKRKERPLITIHSFMNDNKIKLTVEDNGIGIAKANVERIFELKQRVDYNMDGQGVGLYLVKKIITAAGGTIQLESEPGKGSKFIIEFKTAEAVPIVAPSLN